MAYRASKAHADADRKPAADRPPVLGLFVLMVATAAFVVASGLAIKALLAIRADAEIAAKTRGDAELAEVRASSKAALDRYEVVDAAASVYQVPVTRAMEMVVRDPSLLAPVAAAPSSAATPAAPAAPSSAATPAAPAAPAAEASPAGAPEEAPAPPADAPAPPVEP
jgi:hypothetical protein